MGASLPDTEQRGPHCPHCGELLHTSIIARASPESRMTFKLAPHPGELLSVKNVGGAIAAFGDLMKSIGREQKVPTEVLIEKVETTEAGEIQVHILIARWEDHHHSAKSAKKRRSAEPPLPEPSEDAGA